MKFDAYQMVTDRICELLEQGLKPWAQPWSSAVYSLPIWSGDIIIEPEAKPPEAEE